jgi:curved DNA-binding protein CbpA
MKFEARTTMMSMSLLATSSIAIFIFFLLLVTPTLAEDDLYMILGVSRKASTKEIKSAYRKKALSTHPDKNTNKPPEEAAKEFHKVVHAFEVLTDEASRRNYDRTGRDPQQQASSAGGHQQGYSSFQWTFRWNTHGGGGYARRLKDKFEVKEAQSRVMHIVSLEQLKTVMLDETDRLERNLLMIFVTPQRIETIADDELVFPYPFAAMSSQGIWWEDLLQTVKVRYNNENDLTRFFQIPHGDELREMGSPIVLFGKRGEKLDPSRFERLQTSNRDEFDNWVWRRIQVQVIFLNKHSHPVELYWIHNTRAKQTMVLQPGESRAHYTMLSHEWWARDARVDTFRDTPGRYKLSKESSLGSWKILSDVEGQEIVIEPKTCFDMSGHCTFWNFHNECTKNPNFMGKQCRKTCKLCREEDDQQPTANTSKHQDAHSDGKDEF